MRHLNRRILLLSAGLLLLSAWAATGFRRIPDGPRASVRVYRMGLLPPRALQPGVRWLPPGLAFLVSYPVGPASVILSPEDADPPILTAEGARIEPDGEVRVEIAAASLSGLHATLGPHWETRVRQILVEALRRRVKSGALSDPGPYSLAAAGRLLEPEVREALSGTGITLVGVDLGAAAGSPAARARRAETGLRILLVGLDSADWKVLDPLIAAGRMPNLEHLMSRGVHARMRSMTPLISPVLWTSMATGKTPEKHGIFDFIVSDPATGAVQPITSAHRKTRAFWNILSEAGIASQVVGWWASWPAEPILGAVVTDQVAYQLFTLPAEAARNNAGKIWPPSLEKDLWPLTVDPRSISEAEMRRFLPGGTKTPAALRQRHLVEMLATSIAAQRTYQAIGLRLLDEPAPLTAIYFESPDMVSHLFMRYRAPRLPGVPDDEFQEFREVVDRFTVWQDEILGELIGKAGPETTILVCSDHGFKTGEGRPLTPSTVEDPNASFWHQLHGIFVAAGPGIRPLPERLDSSILDLTPTLLSLLGLPVAEDMDGRSLEEMLDPSVPSLLPVRRLATYEGGRSRPLPTIGPSPDEGMIEKLVALGYVSDSALRRPSGATGGGGQTGGPGGATPAPTANTLTGQALRALETGRGEEAWRDMSSAVRQAPTCASCWTALGRAASMTGRAEEAVAAFRRSQELDPRSPEASYWLARHHFHTRDLRRSEEEIEESLRRDPRWAPALALRGFVRLETGRNTEAGEDFRRAAALDPELPDAWTGMGDLEMALGRSDRAREAYLKALRADPMGPVARIGLSRLEAPGSREAEKLLREATRLGPWVEEAWTGLAQVLKDQGRGPDAIETLRNGAAAIPGSSRILTDLGDLLLRSGNRGEAEGFLEKAVALDPYNPDAHNNLGVLLATGGDPAAAIPRFREAVRLRADFPNAWRNLARAYREVGQSLEAEDALRRASSGNRPAGNNRK